MSVDHPVSGSWCSRRCQGWVHSCGIGLRLDQPLLSHCHNLCGTMTPAHFISKTDCKLKVLWVNWCPNASTKKLAWRWSVLATYALLLGVLGVVILRDSPFQLSPFSLSLYHPLTWSFIFPSHSIYHVNVFYCGCGCLVFSTLLLGLIFFFTIFNFEF